MRYGPQHKQQTRERLVETARKEFREHGFERASIDKLMKAASMTRGAFYAHFSSKEALVHEVLAGASGLSRDLSAAAASAEPLEAIASAFETYLDPATRLGLIYCPLVAHAMDAHRGGEVRRKLYEQQLLSIVRPLEQGGVPSPLARVLTTLAVGAAQSSISVQDEELAGSILRCAAHHLRGVLGSL